MATHRYAKIWSKEINVHVRVQLTGPAVPINHYPEGWQQVTRQMRRSFPEWQGSAGYEIQVPILLDGFRHRTSKNADIRRLERLTEPTRRFDPMRPPIVRFDSDGDIPHDHTNSPHKLWIIAGSGIEYGDYFAQKTAHQVPTYRVDEPTGGVSITGDLPTGGAGLNKLPTHPVMSSRYHHTRMFFTLHFWEWFSEEVVTVSLHNQPYKIKKGDTLQKIAREFYGDPSKWRAIARKNHIRDPNHPRVGKTIKLP